MGTLNPGSFEKKLNRDQRMLVLRLHSEGVPSVEIAREVKDQFNITISLSGIYSTCKAKEYQPYIKYFRDAYLNDVKKVPISHKRIRLNDKEIIRKKLMEVIIKNPLKSGVQKEEFLNFVAKLNLVEAEARAEMEKTQMLGQITETFRELSDENLKQRKRELVIQYRRITGDVEQDDGNGLDGIDTSPGSSEREDTE